MPRLSEARALPGPDAGVMLGNGTRWHIRCLPADVHGDPVLLDDGNELESRAICIRCGQPIALESWARHEYASERRQAGAPGGLTMCGCERARLFRSERNPPIVNRNTP